MIFSIFMCFMRSTLHVQYKEYYKRADFFDAAFVAIILLSEFCYMIGWYDTVKPKQFYAIHYHSKNIYILKWILTDVCTYLKDLSYISFMRS